MIQTIFDVPPATPEHWLMDWYCHAQTRDYVEATAMSIATVSADGRPSNRVVLCKHVVGTEIWFFTNYDSRKAQELPDGAPAAACFWWDRCARQIRLEGTIRKLDAADSDAYFERRPRGSQIGAWASRQSHAVDSREALEQQVAAAAARYAEDPVPRPPNWGGYALRADAIEFWQGRDDRLHDRMRYERQGDAWIHNRLQP